MGGANESLILANGVPSLGLIDTGSQITTVSRSYVSKVTSKPIQPLGNILNVQGAGGNSIPYLGYVELAINLIPEYPKCSVAVPVLVVEDTEHNARVPFIIGVNLIRQTRDHATNLAGDNFVQKLRPATAVCIGFRAVRLRDRHLERSGGVISSVRAVRNEVIPSGMSRIIPGYSKSIVPMPECVAITHASKDGIAEVGVAPALIQVSPDTSYVPVPMLNTTDHDIVIPSGKLIGELHIASLHGSQPADTTERSEAECDTSHKSSSSLTKQAADEEYLQQFDLSHLPDLVTQGKLTESQSQQVRELLLRNRAVFSTHDLDVGHTNLVTHRIDLVDETPIKQRSRFIPPRLYDELRDHLQQLLDLGIIRESNSPWSQNLVFARKKDGSLRICEDFRLLNSQTIKDAFEIPRMDDLLNVAEGMCWVTSLDLSNSYWQIEVEEEHKARTAFSAGALGHFEWNRLPFGLCNAPSSQQRLMSKVLKDYLMKCCVVYLDDILVFSRTFEDHLRDLQNVMDALAKAGLKLKPRKCDLFKKSTRFVGHIVSDEGIKVNPEYTEAVADYPVPVCHKDVERFLGVCGFYRRFIKSYAEIARPLTELLVGRETRSGAKRAKRVYVTPFVWGDAQKNAFERLKACMTTAPVLRYPDFTKPFLVRTDASGCALGAVLCQRDENTPRSKPHVVAYASRSLRKGERGYSAYKLEFKALHWAITTKFKEFLRGSTFIVETDHNPLVYLLKSAKLDATTIRWVGDLASYSFSIQYKRGVNNRDADCMSRIPHGDRGEAVTQEQFRQFCRGLLDAEGEGVGLAETLDVQAALVHIDLDANVADVNWPDAQASDPDIGRVRELIRRGVRLTNDQLKRETPTVRALMRDADNLTISRDVLYRLPDPDGSEDDARLVLPQAHRAEVFRLLHCQGGHPGRDKTKALFAERVYWPGMHSDLDLMVRTCERCRVANPPNKAEAAALSPIVTSQPMELVCIDYLSLDPCKGNVENVLVVTDHFTGYAQAFATRNQTAQTTAKALLEHYFVHYGFPQRLHSDQGQCFTGKVIAELCRIGGVSKSRTTPYHAMGNGKAEQFNRTLIHMIRSLPESVKRDWKSQLPTLAHAYNSTINSSTGFSPFFLMFGRKPRLSADIFLGLSGQRERTKTRSGYVWAARNRLELAYRAASEALGVAAKRNKTKYDARCVRGAVPEVGDRVLVRREGFKSRHKVVDVFEPYTYVIVERPNPDLPVYKVVREDDRSKGRVLHRNMLLPLALPLVDWSNPGRATVTPGTAGNPKTGSRPRLVMKKQMKRVAPTANLGSLEDDETAVSVTVNAPSAITDIALSGASDNPVTSSPESHRTMPSIRTEVASGAPVIPIPSDPAHAPRTAARADVDAPVQSSTDSEADIVDASASPNRDEGGLDLVHLGGNGATDEDSTVAYSDDDSVNDDDATIAYGHDDRDVNNDSHVGVNTSLNSSSGEGSVIDGEEHFVTPPKYGLRNRANLRAPERLDPSSCSLHVSDPQVGSQKVCSSEMEPEWKLKVDLLLANKELFQGNMVCFQNTLLKLLE